MHQLARDFGGGRGHRFAVLGDGDDVEQKAVGAARNAAQQAGQGAAQIVLEFLAQDFDGVAEVAHAFGGDVDALGIEVRVLFGLFEDFAQPGKRRLEVPTDS